MLKKVIGKIIVGGFLLAMIGAIVAGIVFLAWPSLETHAGRGRGQGRQETLAQQGASGQGQGRGGQGARVEAMPEGGLGRGQESGGQGARGGYGRGQDGAQGAPANQGGSQGSTGRGQGQGGQGARAAEAGGQVEAADWETVEGAVVETVELVVQMADGQTVQVGLGPSHYRESQGFALEVGDRVKVSGYWEDGEFKAMQVENLDTGDSIVLRDLSGRPMWAGQGRRSG